LQSASVSVDGLEETHDALRGVRGSYASAMAAIANLRAAGVQVSSNSQFGRHSLREMPEVFETLTGMKISQMMGRLQGIDARVIDARPVDGAPAPANGAPNGVANGATGGAANGTAAPATPDEK